MRRPYDVSCSQTSNPAIRIGVPRFGNNSNGSSVVTADVDGEPIWFSSQDIRLSARAEAFASALLVPAAAKGCDLFIEGAVDPVWLENSDRAQDQLNVWWQFPGARIVAREEARPLLARPTLSAQCFTGGVDSYYELITSSPSPDLLVFVHGYDIQRHDTQRLEAFLPGFYETAKAFGAKPVVITTNLREHPRIRESSWEKSHGGALAAVGHLLTGEIATLTLPASYPYHDPKPWGSHWDLDPLWSSTGVEIRHGDATHRRNGKVKAIATNDLALRYVRVCHENNAPTGNCSHCEKCVRTMIAFANAGMLDRCEAFDQRVPLATRVDRLPVIGPHLISIMKELRRDITDQELAAAVDRLIARSSARRSGYRKKLAKWHRRVREAMAC
ncbi:MAG: hypothetical protein QM780_17360 [Hyphomicrobium sp.]|uniref:hypothetical protein n=1 Tax=Hyphomicrobium sp. TaxID=82 RepID=UPI0039E297B0